MKKISIIVSAAAAAGLFATGPLAASAATWSDHDMDSSSDSVKVAIHAGEEEANNEASVRIVKAGADPNKVAFDDIHYLTQVTLDEGGDAEVTFELDPEKACEYTVIARTETGDEPYVSKVGTDCPGEEPGGAESPEATGDATSTSEPQPTPSTQPTGDAPDPSGEASAPADGETEPSVAPTMAPSPDTSDAGVQDPAAPGADDGSDRADEAEDQRIFGFLPRTGFEAFLSVALGAVLVAGGALLVSRRSRQN